MTDLPISAELFAEFVLKTRPTYVLPIPPSDNCRTIPIIRPRSKNQGKPPMISSDLKTVNKWFMPVQILATDAREYIGEVRKMVGNPETVEKRQHMILCFKPYFDSRRRDGSNIIKILQDALFIDDKRVCTWVLPTALDKARPHVDVWLIPLGGR